MATQKWKTNQSNSLDDLGNVSKNIGQTASQIWLFSREFAFFGEQQAHHLPKVWRTLLAVLAKRSLSIYLVTLKGLLKNMSNS